LGVKRSNCRREHRSGDQDRLAEYLPEVDEKILLSFRVWVRRCQRTERYPGWKKRVRITSVKRTMRIPRQQLQNKTM
jgi:site-specific DNA-adenine methylase